MNDSADGIARSRGRGAGPTTEELMAMVPWPGERDPVGVCVTATAEGNWGLVYDALDRLGLMEKAADAGFSEFTDDEWADFDRLYFGLRAWQNSQGPTP